MADDPGRAGDVMDIVKLVGILFVGTYFLWYWNGGPERWNNYMKENVNSQYVKENILNASYTAK